MEEQKNPLGTERVGRLLIRLAIPTITAQVVNMLYNIVDRIYIGHIPEEGALALTGLGLCFPVLMLITAFSSLIGMGGAPQASIKMGQQDQEGAEKILGNCFVMLLIFALVLTVGFRVYSEDLLYLFGASEDTITYALDYLNIYVLGTVSVMFSLGLNAFITTQGFTKISMLTTVIGAVVNIVLDPIFIFGFNMGVQGAALATILAQTVSAVWVLKFLFGKDTILRIRKKYMRVQASVILPVLALGLSPFIMTSTESLLNICFNTSLQKYGGDIAVGSMTILASCMQLCNLPLQGLAQGAQPIISYNFGARQLDRVKVAFRLLFISALCASLAVWGIIRIAPGLFPSLFSNDGELITYASWAIQIYMGMSFAMGAQIACQQTFVAIGEAKISLFLALFRKILVLIPLIYILPGFFENKVFAVFLAEPVADTLAAATTTSLFVWKFRRLLREYRKEQAL
ncbi:MAG: MATE family efflux transporter [Lachnospiraceae bacterium]|nr:MATE family efflux transporter [Lachnospiraceae bacterium]